MAQFNDENFTAIAVPKGEKPTILGDHYLVIGRHRLKYLTKGLRDKDFDRFNNKNVTDEPDKAK